MSSRRNSKDGFQPTWLYVVGALVVGLIIPDKFNPVAMILNRKKEDKPKTD
ncbi:hypothetical protein [Capnocytophaga canis]|uniref:Uncharacterized protein n=1 Tax=Capnocytophaga canis TaxID=1848903 RepID=A0A0B7IJ79_9FLAO|nr:hypothetical protein [Capnocytophaga canis]CEN51941.1 hypothetical protein CCAND93_20049 [Capnocytophaga canis]